MGDNTRATKLSARSLLATRGFVKSRKLLPALSGNRHIRFTPERADEPWKLLSEEILIYRATFTFSEVVGRF